VIDDLEKGVCYLPAEGSSLVEDDEKMVETNRFPLNSLPVKPVADVKSNLSSLSNET